MTLWSQEKYLRAWHFAAEAHQGQTVPGTQLPYLVHLSAVTMEVMTALAYASDGDADLAVQCALLHDSIEDTAISHEQLAAEFGDAVAAGVAALSKNPDIPNKVERMRDSLARLRQQPCEVQLVKLADRITNLQKPPAHWAAEKIVRYREEAQEILATLGDANDYLAARLQQKIANYPENA